MITAKQVKEAVCEHMGVTARQIAGHRKTHLVAFSRQIAMSLTYELNQDVLRHSDVAEMFRCERSNVGHAIKSVKDICETNPNMAKEVAAIREKLKGNGK